MTSTDQIVERLIREVDDLLGAGRVGLYEFIDILRAIDPDAPIEDWRATSCAALEQLLRTHRATMRWQTWGAPDSDEAADDVKPADVDWLAYPSEQPYLVVAPME